MNLHARPVSVTGVRRMSYFTRAGVSRGANPLEARILSEKALTRSAACETGAGSGIANPFSDLPKRMRNPTLLLRAANFLGNETFKLISPTHQGQH